MLKQLELKNFQKHSHLILDFTNGVNIILGETNVGKSCIVRALQWVFFNEPKGDVIRKEGTKKTSVKVTFEDGIIVEKIKSATVNAYILKIGDETKRFDAIGKTIPEEIQKVLKTRTIKIGNDEIILNIANQISLPFLLDKSGTFRMKLFNQLTGNDIIDKVFQSLNKDILHINKEEKLEKEHLEEQQKTLKELLEKKEKIQEVYNLFTTQYNELKEKLSTYEKVNNYSQKLNNINKDLNQTNNKLKDIKIIDEKQLLDLDASIKRLERLNELLYKIKTVKKESLNIEKQLERLKIPKINIKELQEKITKLTKLQKMIEQLQNIEEADENFTKNIIEITKQIEINNKKYKEILKESGICPTCRTKVTEDIIKKIKL